jgi:hypothetical protein
MLSSRAHLRFTGRAPVCCNVVLPVEKFSSNGQLCLNCLCQSRGQAHFVLVSLESILLKDPNEPISKNIGERIAFLIGNSVEERRAVVQNVDAAYRIRSKFIHHGESAEESDVVEQFCAYAWQCFHALLHQVDTFLTKAALIEALENRKLS